MNAIQTLLTDHLDIWTSALLTKSTAGRGSNGKLEAYGIKKLRELIYELAAKGLLVDFASDAAAKTARIGDVADLVMGQAPPGNECNKDGVGTIFVKTGEFGNIYPEVVEWTTKPLKLATAGDVLICVVGATVGKLNLAIDCAIGRSVAAIRPRGDIDTKYLYFSLMPYTLKLRSQSRGSAQGVIGKEELNAVEIRLPSLKEQHRIVAKVDELMALCDQLEQQQTDGIAAHQTLVETLLGTLTRVESQQEFNAAWARIASYFDTLFTTEASIDQLKQTLLQLAVMGKLVPQDPSDEPASVFLEKVAQEKAMQIKAGEIRKQKELPEIQDDEIGLNLSAGWAASRLGTFTNVGTGATPSRDKTAYWSPQEVNWVASGETSNDFITETSEKISSLAAKETNVTVYPVGALIVAMYGQGKTRGQVSELMIEAGTNQACAAVVLISKDEAHRKYLKLFFKKAYEEMRSHSAGGAQPNLNVGKISNTVVPIPPLAEQHRIVAKVDELMALCDALKARLADAQTTQLHLADAIVERAVC